MSGKGDKPRPIADREKYNSEFDRIFKVTDPELLAYGIDISSKEKLAKELMQNIDKDMLKALDR